MGGDCTDFPGDPYLIRQVLKEGFLSCDQKDFANGEQRDKRFDV